MDYFLEALKLLKEWSATLVVIQTGVIALIGGFFKNEIPKEASKWLIRSLLSFLLSIVFATFVLGAIPGIIQYLPENIKNYGDIYRIPNYIGIPLFIFAFLEHSLFILGIGFFVKFIFKKWQLK